MPDTPQYIYVVINGTGHTLHFAMATINNLEKIIIYMSDQLDQLQKNFPDFLHQTLAPNKKMQFISACEVLEGYNASKTLDIVCASPELKKDAAGRYFKETMLKLRDPQSIN